MQIQIPKNQICFNEEEIQTNVKKYENQLQSHFIILGPFDIYSYYRIKQLPVYE